MRAAKSVFLVVSVLMGVVATSSGQIDFFLSQQRHYRQHPSGVEMRGALWQNPFGDGSQCYLLARLRDGSITVTGCPLNGTADGDPSWFPPVPLIGCELGGTGYIVEGDVGGAVDDDGNNVPDGVPDDASHWEVVSVTPAQGIHYLRPDKTYLYAAPPSTLPRNQVFMDATTNLYYNTQTESIREYFVSGYDYWRDYYDRPTMDRELVLGEYHYRFPRLGSPDGAPVDLRVTLQPIPEGYQKKNHAWQGHRFTRLNGQPLVWSSDGYIQMDPRLNNVFEWAGNDQSNIFPNTDLMYFSVAYLNPMPATAAAPFVSGPPTRREALSLGRYATMFPFDSARGVDNTPGTPRVRLPHALTTSFSVPGRMIRVALPNSTAPEGVVRLELLRSTASTAVSSDDSYRCYELPVRFVNTYAGWAATAFVVGTPDSQRVPTADPDGDRFSNQREWLFGTNPSSRASVPPGAPGLAFVPSRPSERPEEPGQGGIASVSEGAWELRHPIAVTWPVTQYDIEFSSDLVNWQVIGNDDPNWEIIREDPGIENPHIIARSRASKLTGNGFLRVRETTLADDSRPSDIPLE